MSQQSGARVELRTNMFVLAKLSADSASGPVKIRNMSRSGALIEGAALPLAGERAQLYRGSSSVCGKVAWSQDGRAGLHFDAHVDVAEWMPGGQVGQQRVDTIVEQLKSGTVPAPGREDDRTIHLEGPDPAELRKLAKALDSLADDLADDAALVARFGSKLQTLDIASQMLRKLSVLDLLR